MTRSSKLRNSRESDSGKNRVAYAANWFFHTRFLPWVPFTTHLPGQPVQEWEKAIRRKVSNVTRKVKT
jgi:hypothetical protein